MNNQVHTKCPLNVDWIKMAAASSFDFPANLSGVVAGGGTNSGEDGVESTIASSCSEGG